MGEPVLHKVKEMGKKITFSDFISQYSSTPLSYMSGINQFPLKTYNLYANLIEFQRGEHEVSP